MSFSRFAVHALEVKSKLRSSIFASVGCAEIMLETRRTPPRILSTACCNFSGFSLCSIAFCMQLSSISKVSAVGQRGRSRSAKKDLSLSCCTLLFSCPTISGKKLVEASHCRTLRIGRYVRVSTLRCVRSHAGVTTSADAAPFRSSPCVGMPLQMSPGR